MANASSPKESTSIAAIGSHAGTSMALRTTCDVTKQSISAIMNPFSGKATVNFNALRVNW